MKNKIVVACLLMSISGFLFLISGCASTGPLTAQQANYPADKVDARGLFVENCATCHGKNGRAHTFHGWLVGAQNLTSLEWQVDTTDEQIVHAIKTGPGVMPAFEKKLSPSEIEALAKYVRSFRPDGIRLKASETEKIKRRWQGKCITFKLRPMKMNSVVKGSLLAVLFLAVVFISGCATAPPVDWNSRVGHYTYAQAVNELGPPNRQSRLSNGATVVQMVPPTRRHLGRHAQQWHEQRLRRGPEHQRRFKQPISAIDVRYQRRVDRLVEELLGQFSVPSEKCR